jgi:hypothetical protein
MWKRRQAPLREWGAAGSNSGLSNLLCRPQLVKNETIRYWKGGWNFPSLNVEPIIFPLKGTVQRDFTTTIFSQMDSSQAPIYIFKDFANLASNSRRYSRFLIDSPLLFIGESRCSPYCLLRRVSTPRIVYSGESQLTANSHFQKLWRTPPSFKGTMKQKYRALLIKNIFKK